MRIPKPILEKLAKIAALQETEFAINGIHFVRHGKRCVAEVTDARMLVRMTWMDDSADNGDYETIVCAGSIKRSQRGTDGKGQPLHIEINETEGTLLDSQAIETIGGRFPNIDEVIPNYTSDQCQVFKVDLRLFAKLLDSMAGIVPSGEIQRLEVSCPTDRTKPVKMKWASNDMSTSIVAVIMQVAKA